MCAGQQRPRAPGGQQTVSVGRLGSASHSVVSVRGRGSFFKECEHPRSRWSKCPHPYRIQYRTAGGRQVDPVDLFGDAVDVIGDDVVEIDGEGLAVAHPASAHQVRDEPAAVVAGPCRPARGGRSSGTPTSAGAVTITRLYPRDDGQGKRPGSRRKHDAHHGLPIWRLGGDPPSLRCVDGQAPARPELCAGPVGAGRSAAPETCRNAVRPDSSSSHLVSHISHRREGTAARESP